MASCDGLSCHICPALRVARLIICLLYGLSQERIRCADDSPACANFVCLKRCLVVESTSQPGAQISKYVEREIINHKQLRHPHIVELKEVRCSPFSALKLENCTVMTLHPSCHAFQPLPTFVSP